MNYLGILLNVLFKLNGKWTSPGGNAKKFTCCSMDLSITWYPGKQNSLILHGEESLAVTEMLINVRKALNYQATAMAGYWSMYVNQIAYRPTQ
jgi:hypothetical protein